MRITKNFFEINSKKIDGIEQKYIHIMDVLMVNDNIGNGTVAMKALIKYAKRINAKWIDGRFSSVDNDYADRRNHYYKKFGFNINGSQIHLDFNQQIGMT